MFTSTYRKAFLLTILALVIWALATNYGYCQEAPRVSVSTETVAFSDSGETYLNANGETVAEYKYRLAPITGKAAIRVSDAFSLTGRVTYARLYSIQDPPSWAFSPNSAGEMFQMEAALSYYLSEAGFIRGGFSTLMLDRTLNVYSASGYQRYSVQTNQVGPFVGAGFGIDDTIIVRAAFDYFPLMAVRDTYSPYANGANTSNNGFRVEASLGYRFTDHFAVIGSADLQRFKNRDSADGADMQRRIRNRMFNIGLQLSY